MRIKNLPENHPDMATAFNNLGSAYSDLGDQKKAVDYYVKALEITKKSLPENHPDLATSYNNLGIANSRFGDQKKAVEYIEKALEIKKKVYQRIILIWQQL